MRYRLKDWYFVDEDGAQVAETGAEVVLVAENVPFDGSHTVRLVDGHTEFEVDADDVEPFFE